MRYCIVKNQNSMTNTMLYIFNCNDCPHYGKFNTVPICTKYHDPETGLNMLEDQTEIKFMNGVTKNWFAIQKWCGLSDSMGKDFLIDLELCTDVKNVDNYTQKSYISSYKKEDYYLECSCCSVKDSTVERRKNDGMCSKCLVLYKNDKDVIIKSKLKNFKLKRIEKENKKISNYNYYGEGYW